VRRVRSRRFRLIAFALTLVVVAAACGGGDDAGGDGEGGETPEEDEHAAEPEPGPGFDGTTIKLGVLTALTGPGTRNADPVRNGTRVYFDHVNEDLGGVAGSTRWSSSSRTTGSPRMSL
jgi:ABC-type branched-subunit amino acid transport system substrate-binding protein